MNDDLEYVQARLPGYREYDEEEARHDSDMRVRSFVGERLTQVQVRVANDLDDATRKTLEDVLLRCMFTDQVFVRNFEHARLDIPMRAALVRCDRTLVELGESLEEMPLPKLRDALVEIDEQLEYRRSPAPLSE